MAPVVTPYAILDAAVLDADQYNDNLYDTSVAGRGIWSEPNGRLEASNLAPGFLVQAEHIQPGELFRHTSMFELESRDLYSDGIGALEEASPSNPSTYVPIEGASCRIYVPYRCLVEWHWAMFVAPWRVRFDDVNGGGGNSDLEGFHQARIGGALVAHTRRRLPYSVLMANSGGSADYGTNGVTPPDAFLRKEEEACLHYCMHHVELVDTVGYRQLDVMAYLQASAKNITLRRIIQDTAVSAAGEWPHHIHSRATIGITHCWALLRHYPA